MKLFGKAFFITAIIAFGISCTSSKKTTGVWINPNRPEGKTYSKTFVVVMTADVEARLKIESDLIAAAKAKGHDAEKSIDALPVDLSNPVVPTKDQIVEKVKASGCDAVLIASLLRKDEAMRYEPGKTTYTIMPYYTFVGNFAGYYSNISPIISTPGYYANDKEYFMQTNLYDYATQEIIWSVQSTIFSPSSLRGFSQSYTISLVNQLDKAGLLKNK